MIASVRGAVLATGPGWVVVEVGGVGMRIETTANAAAAARIGDETFLHTALIVRDDALTLYGFDTVEELEMFGLLTTVTGVGPRSGLGVLSAMTPWQIAQAVSSEDDKPFRKVSGIGPKTSKLIAVSLAGKVTPEAFAAEADAQHGAGDDTAGNGAPAAVIQGLVGLGWGEAAAEQAVADAAAAGAPQSEAGLLRAALALLQSGGMRTRGGSR